MLLRLAGSSPKTITIASWIGLSIILYPVFFSMMRIVFFGTVPRDDYAPYLLYFLGQPGGGILPSPWGYRFLSVLPAIPFTLLPQLPLSNLPPDLTPEWLAATQALAVFSYLCLTGSICLVGLTVWQRFRCGAAGVLAAGAGTFVLCQYVATYALDLPTIFLICLGVYTLGNPRTFALVIIPGVLANEKVMIVFGLLFAVRFALSPSRWREIVPYAASIAIALVIYGTMLVVLALPGNEHQINPAAFAETFMINMRATLSARGFLLNFMPLAVIGALAAAAYSSSRDDALDPYTRREDWLVIPLLLIVAMLMSLHYNLGRIVMHAFPLFVGPAALALERRLGRRAEVGGAPS